jgi:hypothetical protein
MKIALTLCGQPRNIDVGYKELKKWFLDKYDIDVYMHAWKNKEFKKYNFFDDGKLEKVYKPTSQVYRNILEWYQPKDYLFEKEITFDSSDHRGDNNQRLNSQLSFFLSLKRVWDLVEASNIKYDYVIRARYDLLFTHQLGQNCKFLDDISKLNPEEVHYFEYSHHWRSYLGINDIFAIGGYDVMKIYHNVFPQQIYYQFEDKAYRNWLTDLDFYVNETVLLYHLKVNKVQLNPINPEALTNWWGARVLR